MQRCLIGLFKLLPLWLLYGLMCLVIPFYVLIDSKGRRASRAFYRRLGHSRAGSLRMAWLNMFNMGKVVLDRFAAYAGKSFEIVGEGLEIYDRMSRGENGAILLSAHTGNYEMVGYLLPSRKPMSVLVYGGETSTVMENRSRLFSKTSIRMVKVEEDMSHLFKLNAALASGEFVSLPADRVYGSSKTVRSRFLGEEASFPAGPFKLAKSRDVPVYAVHVMKEGLRRYRVYMDRLPADGGAQEMADAYCASLERTVRKYPLQWYNFFDFWKQ